MNTVTSRLSRWVAGFIAVALVAGGSIVLGAPASAAPATVTGGSLSWGVAADYRAVFATRAQAGGATLNASTDTFSFPAATTSSYDPATKTGTLNFTGNARIGYFAGAPVPGTTAGNYFYIANPVVTLNGASGTISGTTAGDSHGLNPDLPTAALASRVVANLDLSGVAPTVNPEGTTITLSSVPSTITEAGATALAFYNTAGDAAATKRVAGSALDPVTIQLNVVAPAAPATATTTALTAPATAVAGAATTLSAQVAPTAAAGSVEFFDGATSLATAPVASGTASTSVRFSAAGARSITAKFTPSDAAAFAASTSPASTVTVTAAPVVTTPTVTVSKSTVVDAGELVTVTGAGFSPVGTATNAARPPLAGKFGGVYVSFGKFASVWKPSAGATSSARPVGPGGKWVVNAADVATIGGAAAGGVAINADGTFSVQLLVKPGYAGEIANGNYGVYTYPGGGVAYPAFETYTPITFAPTPKVAVSKTTLTSAGETVTVTGSGFSPVGTATNAPRPPLAGKFGGVYVTFGKFASVWKASEGASSAARKTDGSTLKWVVNPADLNTVGGAVASGVAINADGTFSITMLVKPGFAGEPATGNYGIYTYPGGGSSYAAFETYTPIAFAAAPTVTSTSLAAAPVAVSVGGSTTLTAQVTPATAVGSVTFSLGSMTLGTAAVSGGAASMTVDGLVAGVQQFTATFVPASVSNFTGSAATASVTVTEKTVGAGSLSWGIKQSFRDYVSGPIAKGAITTSGVGASGGVFTFGQSAGGSFDRGTGVGTSNYAGTVRFTGHAGLLDVAIGNPVVRVDSATQGTLFVSVNGGSSTPFATLDLAAATRSTPDNTVAYSGAPAALTSQGAAVFTLNGSSFYSTGTQLDPVSFVIGAPNVVSNTIGATVASFAAPKKAAPTPPATTGISFVRGDSAALVAGDEITVTASGFRPNETGVLVVIYSSPTVLDTNATADATGTVTWTGRLPAGLSGEHTLTFQGSVDRGVELTIATAALSAAVTGCVVDDATITWGFKESFRAYISGSIANGEWTVADGATYTVPDFGWSAGTGGYDAETGEGLLAFAGSIDFTGHAGVLNTTVANPQIRFVDANTALVLLDISGTTQDGAAVDTKAVEFAELDLSGVLENDGGAVTITAAPATLTAAGAAAFGTYPAGEELDPVTVAFTTAADCALPAEEEAAPTVTSTADEPVSDESAIDYGWIVWAVLALFVVAAAVVVTVVVRRRRA